MKNILKITCLIAAIFSIYFPFSYFQKNMDKREVKISHILVNTEEKAQELKKQIEAGESFEELAKANSECPSAEDGGDLGYNEHGRLVKNFEQAAFKSNYNVISDPIQTKHGWHILKVTDVKFFSDKDNFSRKYYADVKTARKKLNK